MPVFHNPGFRYTRTLAGQVSERETILWDEVDLDEWFRNTENEITKAAYNKIKRKAVDAAARFLVDRLRNGTPAFGGEKRLAYSMFRVIRSYTQRRRLIGEGRRRTRYFLGVLGPDTIVGPHGHFIEYGTVQRFTKRGYNRGIMPAMPFFEDIMRANMGTAQQLIQQSISADLGREFERIGRGLKVVELE